jgi:NTE family protein
VLGGGGITGAAFHFGTLFSLRMATGWDPGDAVVVVGTSSGAVVAALVRSRRLSLDALIGEVHGSAELAWELRRRIYRRTRPRGVGRWMRHGLLPGLRHPGVGLAVGSPARYTTDGIADWMRDTLGDAAERWPSDPTTIVAYEVETRRRVAFGTEESPDVGLATAVAASSAVPLVFEPVLIEGRHYVDGGVASGTNIDLLLGHPQPLDLVIVIAPMASLESRPDAPFSAGLVDRLGAAALTAELETLAAAWPDTEVVVLRPDRTVLAAGRSNPLDPAAALPTFLATLRSMRGTLAGQDVWPVLERHFPPTRRRLLWGRRLRSLRE